MYKIESPVEFALSSIFSVPEKVLELSPNKLSNDVFSNSYKQLISGQILLPSPKVMFVFWK